MAPTPVAPPAVNKPHYELPREYALLSVYDPDSQFLYLAVTGRSRAVLGCGIGEKGKHTWVATGFLTDSHGAPFYPRNLTPELHVESIEIASEWDDFVVLASSRLWHYLDADEVVALMARWLDEHENIGSELGSVGREKHIDSVESVTATARLLPRLGPRPRSTSSMDVDRRFAMEERNAASQLIRNALGMPWRVVVILFGGGEGVLEKSGKATRRCSDRAAKRRSL
ncbi:uncharacterized protein BO97DRAFT_430001 [Aspergillus homomorphus CBS 101889]|uniref:PPM-type phosphatase domain-containing protein n=1 Tax=Aspergillus homomorphus (strain CBS 101889) TaxID=1450537 RepID=A0A395HFM0_ASPHC|nr:hypothetical protein BO97DRAFT_430001 [Aspergillus homomorphus CBS 101889]RAL06692.1 hypothetical protein BO97DRAFT_430001 [Aspergillus homomorphus CBS 101889]